MLIANAFAFYNSCVQYIKSLLTIKKIHLPVVLQTLSYKKTKTFAMSIFIDLQKSFSRLLVKVTLTINIFLRGNSTLLTVPI